ncbi:MAG: LysM peptidoglycan-binding domain-containing protein [Bacteroidota bacterium]
MKMRCIYFGFVFLLFLVALKPLQAQSTQEQLKQMRSSVIETIDGREFYIHKIKRGQTLYMISKAYGVEVNDLIRENPGVKEGIRADDTLRIPLKNQPVKPPKPKSVVTSDTVKIISPGLISAKADTVEKILLPCGHDTSTKKSVYQVALMLPLFLGEVDAIDADNPDRKTIENARSFQYLPFYEGFRMALDSLKKAGLSIRLYVYDVDKDTAKTRQTLKKPELKSMDLIIGLLYHRNFQIVASFAARNKINIINAVSERSEIVSGNPFVFKVQPDKKAQTGQIADCLVKTCGNGRIVIIRSGQYPDKDLPENLKKACLEHNLNVRLVDGQQAAFDQLSKETENYLIAFSDKPEYAIDLTRRVYELRNDYSITLFGLPDWSAINGIETEYLITLKTHMIAPAFVDYENQDVKKFVRRYQEDYKTDPELLAFQGFDVGYYFLSALQQFGTNFGRCLEDFKINSLQTQFNFTNTKGNGYENQRWLIFKYEHYRLVPANR